MPSMSIRDGSLVLVTHLEPAARPGLGTVDIQVRVDGLEVGSELAKFAFLDPVRLPFFQPLVGGGRVALLLGYQVDVVAHDLPPEQTIEERSPSRLVPLLSGRTVDVQLGIVVRCDLRSFGQGDEPQIASLVDCRATVEMEVGMADLAVVCPIAVVLGLEVDDSHRGIAYPPGPDPEHGAVSIEARRGIRPE
jgi:hypothetical protein